jgi:hypothetical protein
MSPRRAARRTREPEALHVKYWPLDRLVPYARNARTHGAEQVAEIAGSIRAFGFTNPNLVGEDGDIVAGHGRLAAARLLSLNEVPVTVLFGLTELQRRQLVLADNRIALNAGWDPEMLNLELTELSELGVDLVSLGFADAELEAALSSGASRGLADEDEVPAVAEHPVSCASDIWCLGPHRLACGDMPSPSLRVSTSRVSPSAPRSFGQRNGLSWAVGTITGNMSPNGTRCAARALDRRQEANDSLGDPDPAHRIPRPPTAHRSRSSGDRPTAKPRS